MVWRISRERICSLSKLHRLIYSFVRNASTNKPRDGVDVCKKHQRTSDCTIGSHHYDDPNKLRPTVYIAHTTAYSEKNTETLYESLQKKVALQQKIIQDLATGETRKHEAYADDEVTVKTDEGVFAKDESPLTDNVWQFATTDDSDDAKDDKLLQKPEPIRENDEKSAVVDPPSLPADTRYRYETESEGEAFDELAIKYLSVDRDQIDKRLLQDMKRLGLPIDASDATSPSININVSCENEDVHEVVVPKPEESQQKETTVNNNPQYYDKISWCSLYFKDFLPENPSSGEGITENHEIIEPNTFHNDMLPLHGFDFDSFHKSSENNMPIEKLGFIEDDYKLQCQDFIQLDLGVSDNKDKIDSLIESIKVDGIQPGHFVHQENLVNEVVSASNEIEALEQYDFNTSFQDCDIISKPVAEFFYGLYQDQEQDATKFDYTFPRDCTNVEFLLVNQVPEVQTVKDAPEYFITGIIQNEDQIMPIPESMEEEEDKLNPLSHLNLAKPKVAEQQIDAFQEVQKATIDKQSATFVHINPEPHPKTEQVDLRNMLNIINANIMQQVRAYNLSDNIARPHERLDRLVQINPQILPNHDIRPLSHVNLVEPKLAIVPKNPELDPETIAALRNFIKIINAKTMEHIGAYIASENTTQPHKKLVGLVQINPQSSPSNDLADIIHANILEQVRAGPPELKLTTNSIKGIDSIIQMQPQAAFDIETKPQKVALNEPLPETKVMSDNATCHNTPKFDMAHIISKITEELNTETPKLEIAQITSETTKEQNFVIPKLIAEITSKTTEEQNTEIPKLEIAQITSKTTEEQNTQQLNTNTAVIAEVTKHLSRETGTIAQSCVHTACNEVDNAANKLSLDLNLSLTELLKRVRARNRLQYLNEIKAHIDDIAILNSEKMCPPTDRPQCPPPPECAKPCPPQPKPKCPPEPPKCPDPPKCPPEPPKCPPPKVPPKCPPDPPECPPEPPKCPSCPCPPPPKCPPQPPKCPCQATNIDDPVTIYLDTVTSYLRNIIESIKRGFLECINMPFRVIEDRQFKTSLKLNRIKDFEPWTPVPSWPFPVEDKKKKLQCPYHGCPFPKPGPVRPNCPELPCAGFPKRLTFSKTHIR